jgi:hypothetical protein
MMAAVTIGQDKIFFLEMLLLAEHESFSQGIVRNLRIRNLKQVRLSR